MKYFLAISLFFSFSLNAGTEIMNGGGGITIKDSVATFSGSTFEIYPQRDFFNIHSLDLGYLESRLLSLRLPSDVLYELYENIRSDYGREYYVVKEDTVSKDVLNQVKAEYHEITGVPLEILTIFALTDPSKKITLVLPDFFKLQPHERASILFHESLWINGRVKDYKTMLEIDKASEYYFKYRYSCSAVYDLVSKLESIFSGRLWTLHSVDFCEWEKYKTLAVGAVPTLSSYMSNEARYEFSKIILSSYYNIDSSPSILIEELIRTKNSVFASSRMALVNELKKGIDFDVSLEESMTIKLNPMDPLSKENIKLVYEQIGKGYLTFLPSTEEKSMNIFKFGTITFKPQN